jgi:hypothetical protein
MKVYKKLVVMQCKPGQRSYGIVVLRAILEFPEARQRKKRFFFHATVPNRGSIPKIIQFSFALLKV